MTVRLFCASLLAALVLLLAPTRAHAGPPSDCDSPRHAVDSVFAWLQPNTLRPDMAAQCLDPAGRTPAELQEAAKQIKGVYDTRALLVDVAGLSDAVGWVNPETGKPSFAPHPKLPEVVVEKQADGKWRWTKGSLDHVEKLYGETLTRSLSDQLPPSLRRKLLGVATWQYLAIALILVAGLIVRKIIEVVVANRIRRLAERFGQQWASRIVDLFASPGATLAMAAMLGLTYPQLGLPIRAALAADVAVRMLFVLAIILAAYRAVDVVADRLQAKAELTESKLDDQLVPLIRKSLKVLVLVGGTLFMLQNLHVDVGSLIAGLGIGGLAFALAAKDTLANFFGSIMIFADRPFQIGDWIVVTGVEGIVEEVGFRSTRVRSFDNSLVTIPNAAFTESKIQNYGARTYRRCFVTINLTYDTTPEQMQAFVEGARAIVQANEFTRKDYYEIHMSGFGAHSLDVMVYFFFKVESWSAELREKHNVFLELLRLAQGLGVGFAFPTQTLHMAPPSPPVALPKSNGELAEVVRAFGPGGAEARPSGPKITESGFFAGTSVAGSAGE